MPSAKIGPSFPGDGSVGTGRFGAVGFSPSGERPSMQSGAIKIDPMQSQRSSGPKLSPLKDGNDLYDPVEANSLDPRSYDKIRQNLSAPNSPVKPVIGRYGTRAFGDIYRYGS